MGVFGRRPGTEEVVCMSEGREGRNLKRREAMKKWKAVLAVFLSVVLVLQSSNIQAFADVIVGDGESGRAEIVLDKPAEETEPSEPVDEQKDTPPASEPKKEEPAEPAEPATPEEPAEKKDEPVEKTEPVEKAEETKPAETTEPSKETSNSTAEEPSSPETEDTTATLKFDVTGATLTYNQDGEKNVTADTADKTAKVETTQDFKFTVTPDDGQQIASVKAVTSDGAESDVAANDSGEYTLAAANVTDGTTIKVTTEAVPEPETPAEEETTETDTTVIDDTTAEDEETTPEATLNSVQSVDNSISLMAAAGDGIQGGSGTERDPYRVTAGSSVTITEDYKTRDSEWSISKGGQYGNLSNTSIGTDGYWDWGTWRDGEDAHATLTINSNAKVGSKITVRFGHRGWITEDYEFTYFEVVAKPVSATSIDVSIDRNSIMVGETARATATVEPSNAGYTWRSNNTSVATVDSNGRVTAKGIGTATISATTSNGLSGSVRVTVTRNTNNDVEQTTHFYVAYPGVEDPDAGTWNPGNWLYAGEGKASLPLAAETTGGTIITGDLDSLVTKAPTYYMNKTITVDGVTYKWDKDGTRQPGTFTVVWDRAKCADGWNNSHMWDGENKVDEPHLSGTNVWHIDGHLVFNSIDRVTISFNIQNPGEESPGLVDGYLYTLEKGENATRIPSTEDKEYQGNTYRFDGWYLDRNFTEKASAEDFRNIQANTDFYGRYVTEVTYTYNAADGGSVTNPGESVDPVNGTPKGSTAQPSNGYEFDGWYVGDTKITAVNAAAYNVEINGATLKPIKKDGMYTGGTFEARFTQVVFDGTEITVQVVKEGEQSPIPAEDIVKLSNYADGGGTDNFKATYEAPVYKVNYTYEKLDCADIMLSIDESSLPEGYTVGSVESTNYDTPGASDLEINSNADKTEWTLDNVPGGATVTVKLVPKSDAGYTVHYMLKDSDTKLAEDKVVKNATYGKSYTEDAKEITGYVPETPTQQNVTADYDGTEITFWYSPATDTAYTVRHWFQNVEGDEYSQNLASYPDETKTGTTGEDTAAEAKQVEGFTAQAVTQQKIAADGSTVVNVYYDRNTYDVVYKITGDLFANDNYKTVEDVRYGADLELIDDDMEKQGYVWSGWSGLPETMPAKDVEVTGSYTADFHADDLNFTVSGATWTYDGTTDVIDVTGILVGDQVVYTWTEARVTRVLTCPVIPDADGNPVIDNEPEFKDVSDSATVSVNLVRSGVSSEQLEATMAVNPASITVTANNQTKVQGTADPALTTRYTKAVGNEVPGWTGSVTRDSGEAPGTYDITQGSLKLADGSNGFLAGNYELTFVPGTLTITPAPVTPGGGDDGPTPGGGGDTPTPAPVPDPVPADDATDDEAETEEAIDDDTTPLVSPTETIDDGDTPLAAGKHEDCWVHWIILIGMILSSVYFVGVSVRRRKFTSSLLGYENKVLDNDRDNA